MTKQLDRTPPLASLSARRAWIEIQSNTYHPHFHASLSARRAWIEIIMQIKTVTGCVVALRKESVDRNRGLMSVVRFATSSLSARRAWIEILMQCQAKKYAGVALRKESVDRNSI